MIVDRLEDSHAFRGISRILIEEATNPRNMEMMDDADGKSMFTGPCGDTMTFYVKADGHAIRKVCFQANGCAVTLACGSATTRLAEGKTIVDAFNLRPEAIVSALGGLPEGHEHCATLCITALRCAIADCAKRRGWRSLDG